MTAILHLEGAMNTVVCRLVASISVTLYAGTSVHSAPPSPDEIAARLKDSMILNVDYRSEVVMRSVRPLVWGNGEPKPEDSSRRPGVWTTREVASVYSADRLRHVVVLTETPPGEGATPIRSEWIETWDGTACYRATPDWKQITIRDLTSSGVLVHEGGLFDMVVGRYPAHTDLFDQIRRGRVIDTTLKDGLLTHRCTSPDSETTILEVVADWYPEFRLREFALSGSGERHPFTNRLIIDEWARFNGIMLPVRGRVIGAAFGLPPHDDKWIDNVTYYERRSCDILLDAASATAHTDCVPRYLDGARVTDTRLNLSFQIGSDVLAVDGVVYKVSAPLNVHPGVHLGDVLRDAVIISRTALPPGGSTQRTDSIRPLAWVAGVGAGCVTGIVLLWALRLRRSRREVSR